MKIGISTGTFFQKVATENTFDIMRDLGIDTCEIFLASFCEYTESFCDLIKERSHGINIYSLHTQSMQFEPDLFNSYLRVRQDAEKLFRQIARNAHTLGAKHYTMHGPARLKRLPYGINYESFAARLDELDAILKEESNGICSLTFENVHYCFFNTPDFFTNIKNSCRIGTCLDIKQAAQSKIDVYEYLHAMSGRIKNIHLCDYKLDGTPAMPGHGIFDFTSFFTQLIEASYDGPLIMELYQQNYDNFNEIKIGYEYLNSCLEKAKRRFLQNAKF
ncbi:MAG: sugar phosphate isomerase/epimerase [Christensenellaceae bacterium]|jgi:sugar phosphate isomerase/epimerase|nr:sugar phosphate isomerase/epimerase [Christensenellaceae bacterium]